VVEVEHPRLGAVRQVGIGPKFSETPGGVRTTAPRPGQHTDEVLAAAGYTQEQIEGLRASGAVG
jgi:crotonobetainyl-CoA:carnitine CoA-transferase CaiB-like acyl-CoA transferase